MIKTKANKQQRKEQTNKPKRKTNKDTNRKNKTIWEVPILSGQN